MVATGKMVRHSSHNSTFATWPPIPILENDGRRTLRCAQGELLDVILLGNASVFLQYVGMTEIRIAIPPQLDTPGCNCNGSVPVKLEGLCGY